MESTMEKLGNAAQTGRSYFVRFVVGLKDSEEILSMDEFEIITVFKEILREAGIKEELSVVKRQGWPRNWVSPVI